MKKILIATDGSASAHEAVGIGVELAAEHGAQVVFIHVLPPDDYVVAGRLGPALPEASRGRYGRDRSRSARGGRRG